MSKVWFFSMEFYGAWQKNFSSVASKLREATPPATSMQPLYTVYFAFRWSTPGSFSLSARKNLVGGYTGLPGETKLPVNRRARSYWSTGSETKGAGQEATGQRMKRIHK